MARTSRTRALSKWKAKPYNASAKKGKIVRRVVLAVGGGEDVSDGQLAAWLRSLHFGDMYLYDFHISYVVKVEDGS